VRWLTRPRGDPIGGTIEPVSDELVNSAKRELREIDRRRLFWVRLGVETAPDSGASPDDVDWRAFTWAPLRDALDTWLDELGSDAEPAEFRRPVHDTLRLCFLAQLRRAPGARGYRRLPSFTLAEPDRFPPLQFEDGETAVLEDLPIETVRELASGHRRLAIELVSHRAAWSTLYEEMAALGRSTTAQMDPLELEVHAAALGLVEEADKVMGGFDEGWRAVHGLEVPMFDDPRPEE
jgi:hypothetical protein